MGLWNPVTWLGLWLRPYPSLSRGASLVAPIVLSWTGIVWDWGVSQHRTTGKIWSSHKFLAQVIKMEALPPSLPASRPALCFFSLFVYFPPLSSGISQRVLSGAVLCLAVGRPLLMAACLVGDKWPGLWFVILSIVTLIQLSIITRWGSSKDGMFGWALTESLLTGFWEKGSGLINWLNMFFFSFECVSGNRQGDLSNGFPFFCQ